MFVIWGAMWILLALGPLNLLILPVMAVLASSAIRSRSWRPLVTLIASPLPVLFALGASSWFGARPVHHGAGLPGPNFFNLHREDRTFSSSSGCLIDGGEWLRFAPWNLGLKGMCRCFGWPPQTYHGTYPTLEEAVELTGDAATLPLDEFRTGRFSVGGHVVDLGEAQTHRMAYESWVMFGDDAAAKTLKIRAAQAGDDCILIRLTHSSDLEDTDTIYLLDRRTNWPFARYLVKGRGMGPPYFGARTGH